MLKREDLEKDSRFKIHKKELDWLFSKLHIYKYSFEEIQLGKLRRLADDRLISLSETVNYKFITNPEDLSLKSQYKEYCKDQENLSDNPERSHLIYANLKDELLSNQYDPKKAVIIINQYNIIEDGLHRSCILLAQYGEKYKVKVVKIKRKYSKKMIFLSPIYEIKHLFKKQV